MQTRFSLLCCCFLFFWLGAQASGVRGYIRNQAGDPLEFATVYVVETGEGGVSNTEGLYEVRLAPGNYTLVFQYLGYESVVERTYVGADFTSLNVRMQEQALELKEVEIYEGREDPAYTVMRRAIAKADYHRQQIDRYTARVYVKGSGRLLKAPFFVRRELAKEGIDSTVAFTSESVSEVEYIRPNTFNERVISVFQQGEDNSSSPMPYINGSFYQPEIAETISPLSTRAFSYYRFELEGFYRDRGYGINKIKVTPRSRGDNVFEGYIYIVEDYWNIHSLNLSTYKLGIRFKVEQVYAPIQATVAWLPISAQFNISGQIYGFSFEYRYLATISNYQITLNPDLPTEVSVIDDKIDQTQARQAEQRRREQPRLADAELQLAQGEEVSRRDLRRIMRQYEQEERAAQEEPEVVENRTFTVDSTANQRDSSFWAEIRPLPLTEFEVRGYQRRDSLAVVAKAEAELAADSVDTSSKRSNGVFGPGDLLFGETWKLADRRYLEYTSPFTDIQFNPVEGFNLTGALRYRRGGDHPWSVGLTSRYGFAWRRYNFKADTRFALGAPENRSALVVEGGRYISQYNAANPIAELFNTFYALWQERNFLQLYEKEYGALRWSGKRRANAEWSLGAEWAHRRYVDNYTTQTWRNREDRVYASNLPVNPELPAAGLPGREKALTLNASLEVRPWQKYRIKNGQRESIDESSPSLRLAYAKGIAGVAESVTNFDHLDFTFRHTLRPGVRGKLDLRLNLGLFLNDAYVGFPDFKHFPGNQIFLTSADPVASFRLLPYYQYSTADRYAVANVHYQFRKFLLTRIWEVQMLGIKENAFVNYLHTPASGHYTEVGYSIDNILRVLRLEGAVAFQDGKYLDWGLRLSIASNLGGTIKIE